MKYSSFFTFSVWVFVLVYSLIVGETQGQWAAYNDCQVDPLGLTQSKVTTYSNYSGFTGATTGLLKNFATGSTVGMPTVTFAVTNGVGTSGSGSAAGSPPNPSDAYDVFYDTGGIVIVDFFGNLTDYGSVGWTQTITFTGLNPGKLYTFVGTAIRNKDYPLRKSLFTLSGHVSATNNSSTGVLATTPDSTTFLAGNNSLAGTGYVVRWDDINPGVDGTIAITSEATGDSDAGKAYPVNGFMLEEVGAAGNQAPVVDAGIEQQITLPVNTVNLDATVTDDGLSDPNDFFSIEWTVQSGPGSVTFEPNEFIEDPTAVFEIDIDGVYVLKLQASDGEFTTSDTVTITVNPSECPLSDLNGDCKVDETDLLLFALQFLDPPGSCSGPGCANFDGLNGTDLLDFYYLNAHWLEDKQAGSLQVTILPQGAIDAGALWQVDGGTFHPSGFIESNLLTGSYLVEFQAVGGWDTPADQMVQIDYAQTTLTSGTYVEQLGSLQVTLTPQGAIDAGGQWRVDGGPWNNSGVTVVIPVGQHNVEYKPISGWAKPANAQVQIDNGQLNAISGTYTELSSITLVINEFMADNTPSSGYSDPQGEFDDWFEIYNIGGVAIDLGGKYVTDNLTNLTKWQIPTTSPGTTTIPDGGFLVLWADNDTADGPLHVGFNLDASGDEIALVDVDGVTILNQIDFSDAGQVSLVSYGRDPDAGNDLRYFGTPTPGASNSVAFNGLVEDTKFSVDRGFYDTAFSVIITTETPLTTIYYTTDGSLPINPDGTATVDGITYTGPVSITTTTSLRAAAVRTGWKPTNVDTHTYIFLDDVLQQDGTGLPPFGSWGDNGADWEVDPIIVSSSPFTDLDAQSFDVKDALQAVATVSLVMDWDEWWSVSTGLYRNTSTADSQSWEKIVSAEFFTADGTEEFQINCAVSVVGGSSTSGWKSDKVSMRLKFKEKTSDGSPTPMNGTFTGGPTKLNYPVFGEKGVKKFNTLVLDARLNNVWNYGGGSSPTTQRMRGQYTRDQYAADLHNAMGGNSPHGRHVHLYLNGLYWGLYNLHERPDHDFAASRFGGSDLDYDSIRHDWNNVVSGSDANIAAMFDFAEFQDMSIQANYETMLSLLDVDDFITYMLTNFFIGNTDWDRHNWYASFNRVDPDGKWRFHSWDAEKGQQGSGDNVTGKNTTRAPTGLHQDLTGSPEYRLRFADHVHENFFHNGPLSVIGATALYQIRLEEVDRAVVGESARWGDNRMWEGGDRYTRAAHWITEKNRLVTMLSGRTSTVLSQLGSTLYPTTSPPVFKINGVDQYGGTVAMGSSLTMTGSASIYYTLDGSDPREPYTSNAVGTLYSSAITLNKSTLVKARVKDGSTWSALSKAVFGDVAVQNSVRINEIMYHPADAPLGDPNAEYIELTNIGVSTINLNLVQFTNGIDYTFGDVTLAAGDQIVVVKDQTAFANEYNTAGMNIAAGNYTGSLDNGGERIELEDALKNNIHNFRFDDDWYDITDGGGFSLTVVDPAATDPNLWDRKMGWRPSALVGGSPSSDDSGSVPNPGDVVINEVLANSDTLLFDFIELHNTTGAPINIGGWFLSDSDKDDPNMAKYEIAPGTSIPTDGYIVFTEDQHFGTATPAAGITHRPFALSQTGEKVVVRSGLGGVSTGFFDVETFGASDPDVAFGRYEKSTGSFNFVAMSTNTSGLANALPAVGPLVISEIMYNPAVHPDAEYVELLNLSGSPVTLHDAVTTVPWRFTDFGALVFDFPSTPGSPVTVVNNERILLVKDLTAFNSEFSAPGGTQIFVWGGGKLSNGGEKIELAKPDGLDDGVRQYIRVDRVVYDDDPPWPIDPDGTGKSLDRITDGDYGNDVINWQSVVPSPGS